MHLLEQVNSTFQNLLGKNFATKRYLIAVSGGVDSVVLAHLCKQLKLNAAIAHCNFKLRGAESDGDEHFVRDYALKLYFPCEVSCFETEDYAAKYKISIQEAARELRYQWFNSFVEQGICDYVLVAHHANDSVETFFINLLRGAGIDGLSGIKSVNKCIVRPMLQATKEEILGYAKTHQLDYREDSSNASDKYLRNRIRQELIPLIQNMREGAVGKIKEEIYHIKEAGEVLQAELNRVKPLVWRENEHGFTIDLSKLENTTNPLFYLKSWLRAYEFNAAQVTDVFKGVSGAKVESKHWVLVNNRTELNLLKNKTLIYEVIVVDKLPFRNNEMVFSCVDIETVKYDSTNAIGYAALEKIKLPIVVRSWQKGDVVTPLGMKGRTKKVSDVFIDEKLSLIDKERVKVVEDASGKIIWLSGVLLSESVKLNNNTEKVLQMQIL